MQPDEVMDSLAHAFAKEKIRREINEVSDPETLREMVMVLFDLHERQKAMFRQLIMDLHEPA